ncbi:hypothetical protein FRC07_005763 [Ceratobasidium sp. 392]|nr:hypothetical protein FRC07_005763 [Ceratobasidium sp. 392]
MSKGAVGIQDASRAQDVNRLVGQCEVVIVTFQGRLDGICCGFDRLRNNHDSIQRLGKLWDSGTQLARAALGQVRKAINTLTDSSSTSDERDIACEVGGLLELLLKAQSMLEQPGSTQDEQKKIQKRYRKRPWWLKALAYTRDLLAIIAAITTIIPAVNAVVPLACVLGSALAGLAYTIAQEHLTDRPNTKKMKKFSTRALINSE